MGEGRMWTEDLSLRLQQLYRRTGRRLRGPRANLSSAIGFSSWQPMRPLPPADRDAGRGRAARQRLMSSIRITLLKPYASFAQAMQTPDVQTYVNDLRHNYPADVAEKALTWRSFCTNSRGSATPGSYPSRLR